MLPSIASFSSENTARVFWTMSVGGCQLCSWAWMATGAPRALCYFHHNGAQIISFSQEIMRNHLWAFERGYIAYSPCGEADLILLEAIDGGNDADH